MMKKLAENKDMQGVYDVSMSVSAWRSPFTSLKSDYGRVFNAPNPDISLWEATQNNKIIFVTLPTMDSDTTPKELGRLLLGLIKGVAAQKAKYGKQPKIPYMVFCDELGSYKINGFARLESRYVRIACRTLRSDVRCGSTGADTCRTCHGRTMINWSIKDSLFRKRAIRYEIGRAHV